MTQPISSSALHEAADLLRARKTDEATHILINYVKANPESTDAWFLLSFSLQDLEKKQKCLERVLQINPDHPRALERLQKIQSTENQAVPQQKTKSTAKKSTQPSNLTRNIVIGLLAIMVCGASILGAWLVTQNFNLLFPVSPAPEFAQAPALQPTLTSTTVPSPAASHTPTSVPTDTATPTMQLTEMVPDLIEEFALPEGEFAQSMDDIQNAVSTLRGLDILADSPRYIVPEEKVDSLLRNMFLERFSRDTITDQARVLTVLGLIDPAYNLYEQTIKDMGEGLGGFYVPWSDELFVVGEGFSGVEKFIFAHEYDHALTDQHYHLEDIGVYPECLKETDRCSAITALVEGDATALMYQWLDSYASDQDLEDIEAAQFAPLDKVITSSDFAPPYMVRETYFNYYDGQDFVEYLLDLGGWEKVDEAYLSLPASSEQILHPEKYVAGELPIPVELRSLENVLDENWRLLTTETLGELGTQMVLGFNENYLVELDYETTQNAAAGWGGDRYQVYYRGLTNQSVLVVNWIWDNSEEAAEFWEAMQIHQSKRYMNKEVDGVENCWAKINDHFSCIYQKDNNTLWIIAPTMELMVLILDQYPEFK